MTLHQPVSGFVPGAVLAPDAALAPALDASARDLLRFITCGSVDDGKSTLIGRLLYDTDHLFDDQLAALSRDSKKLGTQGGALDLALAVDGLAAEREQGITIDVAYRFFSTKRRSFIVADTPGHEQYTRNMATGASTADLAILLVDARKGLSRQTRRHTLLLSMLGVRSVAVAVNKMDLVGWDRATFETVMAEFRDVAAGLGFRSIVGIPLSALSGDNVSARSQAAPWYAGPSLLEHLETVPVDAGAAADATGFRLPIQWVNRPNLDFRGFAGTVTGGPVSVGQRVRVLPSGETTRIARIVTYDGDLADAQPGLAVTLTLADEVDASRGSMLVDAGALPQRRERFDARLFWMARTPVREGASFLLKIGTQLAPVTVAHVQARTNLHTLDDEAVSALETNDVGLVTLQADRPIAYDPYALNRDTGSLILIDRETFDTVAMGLALETAPAVAAQAAGEAAALAPSLDPGLSGWLPRPIESAWRSAVKTLSWRVFGTVLTVLLAFGLTRDLPVALAFGATDLVVKFALFFGHERLWAHIGLGLRAPRGAAGTP